MHVVGALPAAGKFAVICPVCGRQVRVILCYARY